MADSESNGILWFVAGTIVGASVALLYAPKTGKDSRKYLTKKADHGRETISETGKDLVERGKDLYDRGRELADDAAALFDRGRKLVRG